jgi:hypothetical protein
MNEVSRVRCSRFVNVCRVGITLVGSKRAPFPLGKIWKVMGLPDGWSINLLIVRNDHRSNYR